MNLYEGIYIHDNICVFVVVSFQIPQELSYTLIHVFNKRMHNKINDGHVIYIEIMIVKYWEPC